MARLIPIPCDELRRLYECEGLTTTQLSVYYSCSATTISKRLRLYGIPTRLSRFHARCIPADELRQMYLEAQLPLAIIAQHFGVCISTIYNRCRDYGLPSRRVQAEAIFDL